MRTEQHERGRKSMPFRLDFRLVNVSDDPANPRIISILDPDRYEVSTTDAGVEGFIDKLDPRRMFIAFSAVEKALEEAASLPMFDSQPTIDNSQAYISSRAAAISAGIRNGISDYRYRNINNEELEPSPERHFVIISIDLVGSTRLSQTVTPQQFANVIQTYSREVTLMCESFHGRVLKYMSDGMILYFPTGSMARRHDFAVDCALSLRDLVLDGINPALKAERMPPLSCRIGLDSGTAPVVPIGSGESNNNIDIIGEVVNIAAKIEKNTPANGICAGESIAINVHTMWLKHFVTYPTPQDWSYIDGETGRAYQIYLLNIAVTP